MNTERHVPEEKIETDYRNRKSTVTGRTLGREGSGTELENFELERWGGKLKKRCLVNLPQLRLESQAP